MRITHQRTTAAILLAAMTAASASAAPNGLTQIPIAKVFGDGVADISVERDVEDAQSTVFTSQYGLKNNLEIGIDDQTAPAEEKTYLGNLKYLIAHAPGRMPDMAVGLQNIATGQKAEPYFVATSQPKATGFTLGVIRPNSGNAYVGMAGISYNITPDLQFVTDYIGGSASYSTYGVIANVTKCISVNVAYAKPNSGGNADQGFNKNGYIVNVAYTFHTKPDKKDKEDKKGGETDGSSKGDKPASGSGAH